MKNSQNFEIRNLLKMRKQLRIENCYEILKNFKYINNCGSYWTHKKLLYFFYILSLLFQYKNYSYTYENKKLLLK